MLLTLSANLVSKAAGKLTEERYKHTERPNYTLLERLGLVGCCEQQKENVLQTFNIKMLPIVDDAFLRLFAIFKTRIFNINQETPLVCPKPEQMVHVF